MRRVDIRRFLLLGATTTIVATAGCDFFRGMSSSDGPPFPPAKDATTQPVDDVDVQTSTGRVAGAVSALSRPIVQGPLPLPYLVESPVTLRITNADTGEEVTTLDAKAGQIVFVESKGVRLDGQIVLGAQLAPGNYAISLMSRDAGVVRTTQTRVTATVPKQAPPAAAPPAAAPPTVEPDATPPPATEPASN